MRRIALLACLALAACAQAPGPDTATRAASSTAQTGGLPPMHRFGSSRLPPPSAANADIARDFLDLSFALESGRALPVLTRFDGPVTVRVTGAPPLSLGYDLDRLLVRLREEAGIPIRRSDDAAANITIEAVTREDIQGYLPQAACFVVPNVGSFVEYRLSRRTVRVSWSRLDQRRRIGIFVPADASPQELRDCLHEELAQALGPLNDLFRLPDSVFNDDNVHTVLTGYDMLILRLYYHPALANGMTRDAVASRLPALLAELNPAGQSRPARPLPATPGPWVTAIQSALGPGTMPGVRYRAAGQALGIATARGWTDHRRAFSHYVMGSLLQGADPDAARDHFLSARHFFGDGPETELHRAYVASQLGAHALSQGRPRETLRLVTPQLRIAERHQNAALLSTLLLLRAEALEATGRGREARQVRLDSLGWARYGFGPDWAVHAKAREIASLRPARSF